MDIQYAQAAVLRHLILPPSNGIKEATPNTDDIDC
jgi:hypothetical protein